MKAKNLSRSSNSCTNPGRFIFLLLFTLLFSCDMNQEEVQQAHIPELQPYSPPVGYEEAFQRANSIINQLPIEERIELIGGHNMFFIKGVEQFSLPSLYLSDATQGVHLRKELDSILEKSVAMPSPILLASTWNRELAYQYAHSIGEECRAGGIAVLLGPGMNIYRISQNGRNFEYFGEDPFLAARMVENYVVGLQSTGTMATLKHFLANNTEFRRRMSNSAVDERTLHEIYLPAFKAGIDAGAMAVMTSYNKINGEWSAQNPYVINKLLRTELGFKWLVMSDWWSIWEPEKAFKSGLDLDMPGHPIPGMTDLEAEGNVYLRSSAQKLLSEGKISEDDINRMARNILISSIAMGFDQRPARDSSLIDKFPEHEKVALQTAREGIVLLKNEENILPVLDKNKKILATGKFMTEWARGGGSAEVKGYNVIGLLDALKAQFGNQVEYIPSPTPEELKSFDLVLISVGTSDNEGWDKPFDLPAETNQLIINYAASNPNIIVLVNTGSGVNMTPWAHLCKALVYGWYPGQNGNQAIAEVLAGAVNPSGKLPITIEKRFEDSPGYPYIPEGEKLYSGWGYDMKMKMPQYTVEYDEGVFVGYRWYEAKNIEPLYWFGHGLSYTTFEFGKIKLSTTKLKKGEKLTVQFTLQNTGKTEGAEVAQLYIQDLEASVSRPAKELKNFIKVKLKPGEKKLLTLDIDEDDLSFFDTESSNWKAETGVFKIMVGPSSNQIVQTALFELIN